MILLSKPFFFINNIFVEFTISADGRYLSVINRASLLEILFFILKWKQNLSKSRRKKKHIVQFYNLRYMDDVLFCNNHNLIYPNELETRDTTKIIRSATSLLDLFLDSDTYLRLQTGTYDKRDDFNFLLVNFLFLSSKISSSPSNSVVLIQNCLNRVMIYSVVFVVDGICA